MINIPLRYEGEIHTEHVTVLEDKTEYPFCY